MAIPPAPLADTEPPHDCTKCRRLVKYRKQWQAEEPEWWNAPVPSFGDPAAWLAIIGLAPGRMGAHRTGRPFTGDDSGALLFETLAKTGLSSGTYSGTADDGVKLHGAMILNAVKCLPPKNAPTAQEFGNCRPYLVSQLRVLSKLRVYLAIGKAAHDSLVKSFGVPLTRYPFAHGAKHEMPDGRILIDSYHCSRYNVNTKRLTPQMFEDIFGRAIAIGRPENGSYT